MYDEGAEDVIPEVDEAKQKVVFEAEDGDFDDLHSSLGFDARACSVSLAHINFTALRLLEKKQKQEDEDKVTDPLGLESINSQLMKVLSVKGEWRKTSSGSKSLLDPTNENFQPLYYLRNLHKHTSWEDLKRGRDNLEEDTMKDKCMHKKQEMLNEYFDQFVMCHDTMGRVCGEIREELASGNIDALVESYEEMVSKAQILKQRSEAEDVQVLSPPMIRRNRSASVCVSAPFEPPALHEIAESSSVVKTVVEFTDFLSSLASTQTMVTASPAVPDALPSALQVNQPLTVNLEEAGTEVIAQKLTDSVVGLAPMNQKKDGLVYHNVFRGKDLRKWVKSRITPFDNAATSVCQQMVQEGHLVKMRTSRRTSNAFLQDDHDLYALAPKTASTTSLPSVISPPPNNATSSLRQSSSSTPPPLPNPIVTSLGAPVASRTNASIVEMAHAFGLPDEHPIRPSFPHIQTGFTPSQTPTGTPISTPVHTPTLSRANAPHTSTAPPLPPSFPSLLLSTREKIHSYCKRIWEAVEYEVEEAEDPIHILERAVTRIGKCFDTIYVLKGRDASTVEQVNKSVSPLADVMEKVVRLYVEKVGEKCLQDCKDALPEQISGDEITTALTTHIEATFLSIRKIIAVASHHLSNPSNSPNAFKRHTFSSLPFSWFFDTFLSTGCDTIHYNVGSCEGKSIKEDDLEDEEGIYEGEGWIKGTYKRWDAGLENVKGWVELQGDCETLLTTFDHLYEKFEKVYSPLSFDMQEKANEVVQTVRSLEEIILNKYTQYHHALLHRICEPLSEEDPTAPLETQVKAKRESTQAQPTEEQLADQSALFILPRAPPGPPADTPLVRQYFNAVMQHLMVIHMETVSLSSTFRKRVMHELLNSVLQSIIHSPSYPSRQASVEYAVLLRVINGKDYNPPSSLVESSVADTSAGETTNFTNLSQSTASLPDYNPPTSNQLTKVDSKPSPSTTTTKKKDKSEKSEKSKSKKEAKQAAADAKSESKKSKKLSKISKHQRTDSYSSSTSTSASSQPSRSTSFESTGSSFSFFFDKAKERIGGVTLSLHRYTATPLQIVTPPLSASFHPLPAYDHDIQEDVDKAMKSISLILECLDADW